ncbi:hypothetical protein BDN72DRAFT_833189 [Pluteus cervinus]|uniref:Uncharacterized protein n=1 Tax=Pluteus cervinus TaxID=181527 RepID=A0ACD3BCC3_9AGAR|nr:hypothetical protein BDN72DRAFT_833189 [Pluteus cervinus]
MEITWSQNCLVLSSRSLHISAMDNLYIYVACVLKHIRSIQNTQHKAAKPFHPHVLTGKSVDPRTKPHKFSSRLTSTHRPLHYPPHYSKMSSLSVSINHIDAPARRTPRNSNTLTSTEDASPLTPVARTTEEQYILSGVGSGESGVWSTDGLRLARARPRRPARRHSLEGGCRGCRTSESNGPYDSESPTPSPRAGFSINASGAKNDTNTSTIGAATGGSTDAAKRVNALMMDAGLTKGPLRPHEERFWNWFLQYPMDTVVSSD